MDKQDWIDLVVRCQWAIGTIVIAAMVILYFSTEIRAKIKSLKKFGMWGTKAEFPPQVEQDVATAKSATSAIKGAGGEGVPARVEPTISVPATVPSAFLQPIPGAPPGKGVLISEIETNIRRDPKLVGKGPAEQVEVLIAFQAVSQIEVTFERIYRTLFGSQMRALREANRPGGIPSIRLRAIFDEAKVAFPDVHANRTFDQWAGYLVSLKLGMELPPLNGVSMASVTVLGQEFILYLDRRGYPDLYG